jgi:hypothetical protein
LSSRESLREEGVTNFLKAFRTKILKQIVHYPSSEVVASFRIIANFICR